MNREQASNLIERLAKHKVPKQWHSGCHWELCRLEKGKYICPECNQVQVLPKDEFEYSPVLIGNVLEKMGIRFCEPTPHKSTTLGYRLLELWRECGFSKPLQTILEESGWEVECPACEGVCELPCRYPQHEETLKSPEASALFDYLVTLFL